MLFVITLLSCVNLSAQDKGLDQRIDEAFQPVSDFFSYYVFYPIGDYPFVIYLLVGSALFFTLYFVFPNIRYFWTAINVVRGKYDELEKTNSDQMMVRFLTSKLLLPLFRHCWEWKYCRGRVGDCTGRARCYLLDDSLWIIRNVY